MMGDYPIHCYEVSGQFMLCQPARAPAESALEMTQEGRRILYTELQLTENAHRRSYDEIRFVLVAIGETA
jgi:hypothetical protein